MIEYVILIACGHAVLVQCFVMLTFYAAATAANSSFFNSTSSNEESFK